MAVLSRLAPGTRRGVLGGLAGSAVIVLAGCGSVAASADGSPAGAARVASSDAGGSPAGARAQVWAGAPLCAASHRVDRAVVTLTPGLAQGKAPPARPRAVVLTDAARVRALAAALCGLPAAPRPPVTCPADFGGGYRMEFSAASRAFPPVAARASGCRTVTGVGPARVAGAAFWRTLSLVLGGRLSAANPGGPASP